MDRPGAVMGLVGVVGNIAGVVALKDLPSSYKPGSMGSWVDEVVAHPTAASTSAVAFTIGLVGLAGWAMAVGRRLETPRARTGAGLIAAGALMNAAGTAAPLVLAQHVAPACATREACAPAGVALLGSTLALDSLFNLLLGGGLLLIAGDLRRDREWRRLAPLAAGAGAASIAVSPQVVSDTAARMLAVAGPLWLAFTTITSVLLLKRR